MNNILLKRFPTKIKINDDIHEINADYRNCLTIIMAFEDVELSIEDKYEILLLRLYIEVPSDLELAIEKGVEFLDCGGDIKAKDNITERVYSFEKDGRYIYSAIRQTHNIDLEEIEFLHWWKFVFLFMDVGKDNMFSQLTQFRTRLSEGKLTDEEKKIYIKMRELIDLNYDYDEAEEESEFEKMWIDSEV